METIKQEATEDKAGKSRLAWPIALGVICPVLAGAAYLYSRNTMNDRVSLLIYSLVLAAVVWGILGLSVGLKRGSIKSIFSLAAIFVSLIAGSLYGYSLFLIEEERLFDEKKQARALEAAKRAPPPVVQKSADGAPAKTGDAGEFEGFAAVFINRSAADRDEFLREMNATGWSKILDPGRVGQDRNLGESRAILQKSRDVVAKYRTRHLALVDSTLKGIATLKVSEPSRQKILHSFDSTSRNSVEAIDALWDCESKSIAEYEGIFALLAARKGTWSADNARIRFTSKADLIAFDARLDAIQGLEQKSHEIRQQQREAIDNTFAEPKAAEPKAGEPKAGDPAITEPKAGEPRATEPKAGEPKATEPRFGDPTIGGSRK